MKRVMLLVFAVAVIINLTACETKEVVNVEENVIYLNDSNHDGVLRLNYDEVLGNVEMIFLLNTLKGHGILLINGPGRAVGFDLTDAEDRGAFYFGDGYIGAGDVEHQFSTNIPLNRPLVARIVVYRTLAGGTIFFLELLGPGFFNNLEDVWVEAVYEAEVILTSNGPEIQQFRNVTMLYIEQLENIRLHQEIENPTFNVLSYEPWSQQ